MGETLFRTPDPEISSNCSCNGCDTSFCFMKRNLPITCTCEACAGEYLNKTLQKSGHNKDLPSPQTISESNENLQRKYYTSNAELLYQRNTKLDQDLAPLAKCVDDCEAKCSLVYHKKKSSQDVPCCFNTNITKNAFIERHTERHDQDSYNDIPEKEDVNDETNNNKIDNVLKIIKEAYKLCSCKICECIPTNMNNKGCSCTPCDCLECERYRRMLKSKKIPLLAGNIVDLDTKQTTKSLIKDFYEQNRPKTTDLYEYCNCESCRCTEKNLAVQDNITPILDVPDESNQNKDTFFETTFQNMSDDYEKQRFECAMCSDGYGGINTCQRAKCFKLTSALSDAEPSSTDTQGLSMKTYTLSNNNYQSGTPNTITMFASFPNNFPNFDQAKPNEYCDCKNIEVICKCDSSKTLSSLSSNKSPENDIHSDNLLKNDKLLNTFGCLCGMCKDLKKDFALNKTDFNSYPFKKGDVLTPSAHQTKIQERRLTKKDLSSNNLQKRSNEDVRVGNYTQISDEKSEGTALTMNIDVETDSSNMGKFGTWKRDASMQISNEKPLLKNIYTDNTPKGCVSFYSSLDTSKSSFVETKTNKLCHIFEGDDTSCKSFCDHSDPGNIDNVQLPEVMVQTCQKHDLETNLSMHNKDVAEKECINGIVIETAPTYTCLVPKEENKKEDCSRDDINTGKTQNDIQVKSQRESITDCCDKHNKKSHHSKSQYILKCYKKSDKLIPVTIIKKCKPKVNSEANDYSRSFVSQYHLNQRPLRFRSLKNKESSKSKDDVCIETPDDIDTFDYSFDSYNDEYFKRVQKTLKDAKEFTLYLKDLLKFYQKANEEFERVSDKLKISYALISNGRFFGEYKHKLDENMNNIARLRRTPSPVFDLFREIISHNQQPPRLGNNKTIGKIELKTGKDSYCHPYGIDPFEIKQDLPLVYTAKNVMKTQSKEYTKKNKICKRCCKFLKTHNFAPKSSCSKKLSPKYSPTGECAVCIAEVLNKEQMTYEDSQCTDDENVQTNAMHASFDLRLVISNRRHQTMAVIERSF